MAIVFKKNLGNITISDNIIEEEVAKYCQEVGLYDKVWLAQKTDTDSYLRDTGTAVLKFSIYVKFGQSIKAVSEKLATKISTFIREKTGDRPVIVVINVSGVKSQNLVRRNMELTFGFNEKGQPVDLSDYEYIS